MLIDSELLKNCVNRWQARQRPGEVAQRLGEGKRMTNPDQRRQRYADLLSQTKSPELAHSALERILQGNDLVPVNYLELGTVCARSVCRVHLRDASKNTVGFGTGSLIAPGVLL